MDHHRGRPFGDDGIIPRRVLKVSLKLKDDNLAEVGRSTGESGQKGVMEMQIRISKLRDNCRYSNQSTEKAVLGDSQPCFSQELGIHRLGSGNQGIDPPR